MLKGIWTHIVKLSQLEKKLDYLIYTLYQQREIEIDSKAILPFNRKTLEIFFYLLSKI